MSKQVFIAHDWVGWSENMGRFTFVGPEMDTLICRPYMNQRDWDYAQLNWFKNYVRKNITVYECKDPGPYVPVNSMGTVEEIVDRLEKRLKGLKG